MPEYLRPPLLATLFALAFFGVCFLQSGLDKVTDRKGNLDWLSPHFAKSPFRGIVPLLLSVLTLLEVGSGTACSAAIVSVLAGGPAWAATGALSLVCLTLLCLFAGQRLSKDYVGAAVLAGYSAVALLGLMASGAAVLVQN